MAVATFHSSRQPLEWGLKRRCDVQKMIRRSEEGRKRCNCMRRTSLGTVQDLTGLRNVQLRSVPAEPGHSLPIMCKISLISGHEEEEEEASQTLMLKFFFFAYSATSSGTARVAARRNHIADVKIKTAISWNFENFVRQRPNVEFPNSCLQVLSTGLQTSSVAQIKHIAKSIIYTLWGRPSHGASAGKRSNIPSISMALNLSTIDSRCVEPEHQ
jgi:hypothetical protein